MAFCSSAYYVGSRRLPGLRVGPLAARCTLQAGDLFGDIPATDAYVLAQVLHDWDDESASRILRGLSNAARPGHGVFVLTMLLPEGGAALIRRRRLTSG